MTKVLSAAASGKVSQAHRLPPGTHDVEFSDADAGLAVTSLLVVEAGSRSDVVLHRPAAMDGDPVVSSYTTPTEPIGQGKARVLVAHTAFVPPADVRVDGQTVFTNIANGEFATADVPSGTHEVALLPTGSTRDPILGPLDLTVPQGTVTMVYAVGSPRNGSMDVILHSARLRPSAHPRSRTRSRRDPPAWPEPGWCAASVPMRHRGRRRTSTLALAVVPAVVAAPRPGRGPHPPCRALRSPTSLPLRPGGLTDDYVARSPRPGRPGPYWPRKRPAPCACRAGSPSGCVRCRRTSTAARGARGRR